MGIRRLVVMIISSIFILGAITISTWLYYINHTLIRNDQGLVYILEPGTSLTQFTADMGKLQILSHPIFFEWLARFHHQAHQLKAGEYFFPKGTTPSSMLHQITTATGLIYHEFTIVDGWNMKQVRAALDQNPNLKHVTTSMTTLEIMKQLGHENLSAEGEFYPDTYYFTRGSTDIEMLKRAFQRMQTKFAPAWAARASDLPYHNPYEAIIAASVIEKEAYLRSELPTIAGVLVNRLQKKMLLQFDPTVIYGMGDRYHGSLHHKDLLEDTPYNTYRHRGLPPTAISMPSMFAIIAALHPERHQYYYFVARGDGSHEFTMNLHDHNEAIKAISKSKLKRSDTRVSAKLSRDIH